MKLVDFIITNPRHHLAMFGPVIKQLGGRTGVRTRVLSLCELRGYRTPEKEIKEMGADVHRVLMMRLAKRSRPARVVDRKAGKRQRAFMQSAVWYGLTRWPWLEQREWPALVVLPNDSAFPYDRITLRLRRDSIPFLLMQEGIRFELPGREEGRHYGQGGASAVATWGTAGAEYFKRVGVPSDRIRIVGNPRLDELASRDWSSAARTIREDLEVERPVLLYVSNPVDQQGFCTIEEKYDLFTKLLRAAGPFLDQHGRQLVVTIHSGESFPEFQAIVRTEADPERTRLVQNTPLYPLLHLAESVVVLASTAGLEALLMDRPLGILPVPGAGYVYDYVNSGAAVPLTPNEQLSSQLMRLATDDYDLKQQRSRYVEERVANFGGATEATGELIMELIG